MTNEEIIERFEAVGKAALAAQDRLALTRTWYLKALASSDGMTALEYQACSDELDRRVAELNELEQKMSSVPLTENTPDDQLFGALEVMEEIVRRMVAMADWIIAEGDRLELPR